MVNDCSFAIIHCQIYLNILTCSHLSICLEDLSPLLASVEATGCEHIPTASHLILKVDVVVISILELEACMTWCSSSVSNPRR
jgi:hypothetical protein